MRGDSCTGIPHFTAFHFTLLCRYYISQRVKVCADLPCDKQTRWDQFFNIQIMKRLLITKRVQAYACVHVVYACESAGQAAWPSSS